MHSGKLIQIVSAHAEGEVGNVITGGVLPPPGETLWEMRDWLETDGTLRSIVLNEPRGGVFKHVNLLVPPRNPGCGCRFPDHGARAYPANVRLERNVRGDGSGRDRHDCCARTICRLHS